MLSILPQKCTAYMMATISHFPSPGNISPFLHLHWVKIFHLPLEQHCRYTHTSMTAPVHGKCWQTTCSKSIRNWQLNYSSVCKAPSIELIKRASQPNYAAVRLKLHTPLLNPSTQSQFFKIFFPSPFSDIIFQFSLEKLSAECHTFAVFEMWMQSKADAQFYTQ